MTDEGNSTLRFQLEYTIKHLNSAFKRADDAERLNKASFSRIQAANQDALQWKERAREALSRLERSEIRVRALEGALAELNRCMQAPPRRCSKYPSERVPLLATLIAERTHEQRVACAHYAD